jgi:small multidrug resistance family-3 protein
VNIFRSLAYFGITALFELGGAYLIWLWLRESRSVWYGLGGGLVLFVYGILPTLQPANFGRVQAAYSGMFLLISLLWGWGVDRVSPDKFDVIGAVIALTGMIIIMYAPRS